MEYRYGSHTALKLSIILCDIQITDDMIKNDLRHHFEPNHNDIFIVEG